MKISREDVLKVAALANLELSDAEVDTYRGHLDDILTYIDKLNEVDTAGVEPLTSKRICFPSGSWSCKYRCTNFSLTTITRGAPASSISVNARPCSNGMPVARK